MRSNKSRPITGNVTSKSPQKILVREKRQNIEQSAQPNHKTIDPSNPFGIISTAVIFDSKMEENIRERVSKLHHKINKLRCDKNRLTQQNKELLEKVFQLEYSSTNMNNKQDEQWMNNVRHSVFQRNSMIGIDTEDMGEQSAAVQKLMQGYVDAMQKLEVKFMELEDEKTENINDNYYSIYGLKQKYKSFIKWIEINLPFSDDVQWAFLNYGNGMSAFFSFYRFVVLNSFIIFISYSYFLIKQVITFNNGKYSDLFSYGLPKFTMFSMFSKMLSNVYTTAIIIMMITMTYISFNKWIKENKKLQITQLLSQQCDTNRFGLLSFQCWDFSKYLKTEIYKQKHSLMEEFRLLLQDEKLLNLKQNRSKKEKYILFLRRSIGIIFNLLFVIGSWYAIFMIISTQKYVLNKLTQFGFGETIAKAIHPTIAIIAVGLILPTITFAITEFEHWESKIQTMKNQIWRLYFGRIANLIVAGIPAYIIYKDFHATQFISSTFSDPVDALIEKNISDNTYLIFIDNKYMCFEDVAAYYLIKLVISDFVLGKIIKMFTYYLKQFINTFTRLQLNHAPYNVAESIIEILYTQGLIWFTLPLYPFLALFAPILMYCNFKFEKYVLSKFKGKTDASWKAEETGSFFIIFYNLTLVVGVASNYYFLQSEWPCYSRVSDTQFKIDINLSGKQGAFAKTDPSQPWYAMEEWMKNNSLTYVLNIFENATLFIGIAIVLTLRLALRDNVIKANTQLLQVKDKEIDELLKKLWAQKKRLELQKNENLLSALK